ncbi:hypothetical protein PSY29_23240, partial [Shigella flexneri]|nr:hypothetical protein [Shigella flexneri]
FYLSCGMTHSARVSDPESSSLFALHPQPLLVWGGFPCTLSCQYLPQISKKKKKKTFSFKVKFPTMALNLLWELI